MLSRIYAILFICTIVIALWYQKKYLAKLATEYHAQLNAQTAILPTNIVKNFQTFFYENGILKRALSGDQITYYSDNHFEAVGHLLIQEYDKTGQLTLDTSTEKATGEVVDLDGQKNSLLGSHKQLKYLLCPGDVFFHFRENKGKTQNVYLDTIKKTIRSQKFITIDGPSGHVEGVGFEYFIDSEEFKLNSHVKGKIIPSQKKKE